MTARPPIPPPPYEGGCLCGAVRWRLDQQPLAINACHCMDCKKSTGATNVLMLIARNEAFACARRDRDLSQACRLRAASWTFIAAPGAARGCSIAILSSKALVFIAAGTLDDPSWAVPTSHIWVEKISPGVVMQEDAIKVVGQPSTARC